jgi:hypothetical protein
MSRSEADWTLSMAAVPEASTVVMIVHPHRQ